MGSKQLIGVFLASFAFFSGLNCQPVKGGRLQSSSTPIVQQQALPVQQELQPQPQQLPVQQELGGEGALSPEVSEGRLPYLAPPPAPAPEPVGAGPDLDALWGPPQPYSFGYDALGSDGRSSRQETSDGRKVTGSYTMVGADGINRVVHYVADGDGFRASIITNEPGTETQNPSGVIMHTSQPKAEELARQYGPQAPVKTAASTTHAIPIVPMPQVESYRPVALAQQPFAQQSFAQQPFAPQQQQPVLTVQRPAAASLSAQSFAPVTQQQFTAEPAQQPLRFQPQQVQNFQPQVQQVDNTAQLVSQELPAQVVQAAPLPAPKIIRTYSPRPLASGLKSAPPPSAPVKSRPPVKGRFQSPTKNILRQAPVKTVRRPQHQQILSAPVKAPQAQVAYAAVPLASKGFAPQFQSPLRAPSKTSGSRRVLRPFVLRNLAPIQNPTTTQATLPLEQIRQTEVPQQIFEEQQPQQLQSASFSLADQQQAQLQDQQESKELADQQDQFFS